MSAIIPIVVSLFSLFVSGLVAWLTLLRTGTVRMTQPTIIFFGPDGGNGAPKVFLRTLLYSTAHRGCIVESMFVKLRRGESRQTFNIWVYGDGRMARGSGLFVGHQGVACNHHFLLPKDGTSFEFLAGDYRLEIYATLVSQKQPVLLHETRVTLAPTDADAMRARKAGTYFDWGPDSGKYHPYVDDPPKRLRKHSDLAQLVAELEETFPKGQAKNEDET